MCGSEEIGLTWSRAQAALEIPREDGREGKSVEILEEAMRAQGGPVWLKPKATDEICDALERAAVRFLRRAEEGETVLGASQGKLTLAKSALGNIRAGGGPE
jgi:hypothetical protein